MSLVGQLTALGDDHHVSQYSIIFPNGIPGASGADTLSITLRQDQAFAWPSRETATYDVFYQGIKLPKESVVEATDKSFTLAFRLDQDWNVFTAFNAWFSKCFDEAEGTSDTEGNTRTKMIVQEYGPLKVLKQVGTFDGVKIKSIKPTDNDPAGTDPMRVDVGFIYYTLVYSAT